MIDKMRNRIDSLALILVQISQLPQSTGALIKNSSPLKSTTWSIYYLSPRIWYSGFLLFLLIIKSKLDYRFWLFINKIIMATDIQLNLSEPHEQVLVTEQNQFTLRQPKSMMLPDNKPITARNISMKISSSLSREKKTLPVVVVDRRIYGDKIFHRQSAATLQKTILCYSMPKAERFPRKIAESGTQPTYYTGSIFTNDRHKGTGFGYGTRKNYPDWLTRNMKEYPAPGTYQSLPVKGEKGTTFGIPYKHYEKVVVSTKNSRLNPIQKS